MTLDPFLAWRRRLDGEWLPAYADRPEPGLYRLRKGDTWLPARIWEEINAETGEVTYRATLSGQACTPDRIWPRCAESPVRAGAYRYYQKQGKWPDAVVPDIPPLENDSDNLDVVLSALEAEAIAWFESIGSEIKTQDQADKAANYAEAFLRLECKAIESLKSDSKEPYRLLTAARTKWKPLENKAAEAKVTIKNSWIRPYLSAKAADARRKRNDPKKAAARVLAGASGSRRQSLGLDHTAKIVEVGTFVTYLLGFAEVPAELLSCLQKLANRLVHSRVDPIPGVEIEEKERVR